MNRKKHDYKRNKRIAEKWFIIEETRRSAIRTCEKGGKTRAARSLGKKKK